MIKDQNSVPSIHIGQLIPAFNHSSSRFNAVFWLPQALQAFAHVHKSKYKNKPCKRTEFLLSAKRNPESSATEKAKARGFLETMGSKQATNSDSIIKTKNQKISAKLIFRSMQLLCIQIKPQSSVTYRLSISLFVYILTYLFSMGVLHGAYGSGRCQIPLNLELQMVMSYHLVLGCSHHQSSFLGPGTSFL